MHVRPEAPSMRDDRGTLARLAMLVVGAVVVALVAGGATGTLPFADPDPDGETVLDRVEQRYDSAETVAGNATVTVENDTATESRTLSFVTADPNRSRVEYRDDHRYVAGTNGSVAWLYNASSDTVRVREVPEADRSAMPDAANVSDPVDDNTTARTLRTATVDGQEAYVVAVEPTNESRSWNTTLWVDTDDYRVHRLRTTDGTNRTTVAFDDLRFNVTVHDSAFAPPSDADVTVVSRERYTTFDAAQDATDVSLRRPDGYEFASAVVVTRAGRTVTVGRYTGDANVTVAATTDDLPYANVTGTATDRTGNATATNVTVAGANATYVALEDRGAVVWRDDGVTRAVVADLDREELVAVAERVRSTDS